MKRSIPEDSDRQVQRTRRISLPLLIGGVFFAFVGGFFILGGVQENQSPAPVLPLTFFLVVASVFIGLGVLLVWVAFRGDKLGIARRSGRIMKYESYEDVPWHRREPGALVFLAAVIFLPITIALCVICLTGDVYRDSYDADGKLQVWGGGNKIAAVLILFIQLVFTALIITARMVAST